MLNLCTLLISLNESVSSPLPPFGVVSQKKKKKKNYNYYKLYCNNDDAHSSVNNLIKTTLSQYPAIVMMLITLSFKPIPCYLQTVSSASVT